MTTARCFCVSMVWHSVKVSELSQCSNCNSASCVHYLSLLYSLYFVLLPRLFISGLVVSALNCYMPVTIPSVILVYSNYCLHVIVNLCRYICYGVDMQAVYLKWWLKLTVRMSWSIYCQYHWTPAKYILRHEVVKPYVCSECPKCSYTAVNWYVISWYTQTWNCFVSTIT